MNLKKIISGGQTGADRAALDAALEQHFLCGGYCPQGRQAEDGVIDARYPLQEIAGGYSERTERNVQAADATLIFYKATLSGGTEKTRLYCIQHGKPYKLIDIERMTHDQAVVAILGFLADAPFNTLNVAGPRESGCPGIYDFVRPVLSEVLDRISLTAG